MTEQSAEESLTTDAPPLHSTAYTIKGLRQKVHVTAWVVGKAGATFSYDLATAETFRMGGPGPLDLGE